LSLLKAISVPMVSASLKLFNLLPLKPTLSANVMLLSYFPTPPPPGRAGQGHTAFSLTIQSQISVYKDDLACSVALIILRNSRKDMIMKTSHHNPANILWGTDCR